MYGPTEIGKPPPGWLDPHWTLKLYVAGSQPHVHLHGLQQPPVRFRQGLAKSRLGGGGDRKGSCSPNSFPLTAKNWLQHSMTASLPPLLSVITTLAPTHPDHPAKAQAVAAELKVWKSWRGMRSQRGESNPENQVGKGWKGGINRGRCSGTGGNFGANSSSEPAVPAYHRTSTGHQQNGAPSLSLHPSPLFCLFPGS